MIEKYVAGDEFCTASEQPVNIVYAADDNYAEMLGVSLLSLFAESSDVQKINIYIMESDISAVNKSRIEAVCAAYERESPIWIRTKDICHELNMKVAADRGSLSQYARLFVSSVLPEELDRVLYLDCDTVFQRSVREFWRLDIKGKTVAALMDAFSKYYRGNIGLQGRDTMFNSGVMLIDLRLWRAKEIEARILDFIMAKKGKVQQGDQGALNAVLYNDVYCFEPRFNAVTSFFDLAYEDMLVYRKPPVFYAEGQVRKAVEDPVIIHFTTSFMSVRPWVEGCRHRYVGQWLKYKGMSPWRDIPLRQDDRSGWKQLCIRMYKSVPSGLGVRMAGVLQGYVRPFKNRLFRWTGSCYGDMCVRRR